MYLFVCSVARLRSRTAELLCLFGGVDARCAGVSDMAHYPINDNLLRTADMVFCMEYEHKKALQEYSHYDPTKTFVLNLEDDYERLEPSLVKHLVRKMENLNPELAKKMQNGYELLKENPSFLKELGTYER
jgi:predicted protein tyrosine phosphatase